MPQTAPFERGQIFPSIFYAELSLTSNRSSLHRLTAGYNPIFVLATLCKNVAVGDLFVFMSVPSMFSVQHIQVQGLYQVGNYVSAMGRQIY